MKSLARHPATAGVLLSLALALGTCTPGESAPVQDAPRVGPPAGALVVAGGGQLGREIMERFVELAGGPDGHIVVIPTAGEGEEFPVDWGGYDLLKEAGAGRVSVLHTRDRQEAESETFVAPLQDATGVWIPGGRQWRLVDSYLHTRTHRELEALLERGGVIGGSSAGASILASYLVRGAPEGNHIVMAPDYEEGFGFLRGVAVDQHLLTRGRQDDLVKVLKEYPDLLGLGIDEGTALLVTGDVAEVLGNSKVAVYGASRTLPYSFLQPGDAFDLRKRERVRRARTADGN